MFDGLSMKYKHLINKPGVLFAFCILLLLIGPTIATATPVIHLKEVDIDWLQLGMSLFGGLALFLFGLEFLAEGLKKVAGETLRVILSRLTTNRFTGALTGAIVTGVLNSSSVTTVLVVGFVTAGVMSLSQSVSIIMGANIGSTVTAQILAFNIAYYALIPVAVGFFMSFSGNTERTKYFGMMLMGLGLVFYGMGLMSDGMKPLRSYEPFMEILGKMEFPLYGILAGAIFTGLIQSSAATVGIAIAMASEGLLTLPAGIALALGANIGTCVTALLAAMGKPTEAVRAAVVHVSFNILGVLVWLPLLPLLTDLALWVSPSAEGLEGNAKLAAETPRQIANANTMFNVINTLLFISFTTWFARLAQWLVPEKKLPKGIIIQPEYLNEDALKAPSVALENVRQEINRAGEITVSMLKQLVPAMDSRNRARLDAIAAKDDEVDILEMEILKYLGRLRQGLLSEKESHEHQNLMTAVVNLENLADVIETDLVALAKRFIQQEYKSSVKTGLIMSELYDAVCRSVALAVQAVGKNDQRAAEKVLLMKGEIADLAIKLFERQAHRLPAEDPDYLNKIRLQMSIVEQLRRIYSLAKRIARTNLPFEVVMEPA